MLRAPLAIFVLMLAGCPADVAGPSSLAVGAKCTSDRDCANICTFDPDFGNGMCTRVCTNDKDCPSGAVCITDYGGICAAPCAAAADCAPFPSVPCAQKKNFSGGGVPFYRN